MQTDPLKMQSNIKWKEKVRAFFIHLGVSALVAAIIAWLIYKVWYPYPYRDILWGQSIYKLLIGVDVIVGPTITFIVFNKNKSFFERTLEIIFIVALQIGALGYGIWALAQARPAQIVFEYDHFQVVPVYLVPPPQPGNNFDHQIALEPWTGPNLISLRRLPQDEKNIEKWKKNIEFGGPPISVQPSLWQAYDLAHNAVIAASRPLEELLHEFPKEKDNIHIAAQKTGIQINLLTYIPIYSGTKAGALLLKKETSEIVGMALINSMQVPKEYGIPELFENN